ncbi:MAG: rod shape-determining protein MreD [Flavobacteriales bacterium]|nr:rod shape-determining protein MreD [Flavobacteriales bacterium]
MIKESGINILRFFLLILFQVLILNNVELGGYLNPFLYVLILLLLPIDMPKGLVLAVAFFTGFCIDIFSDSIGLHSSACVLLAFIRPLILKFTEPRGGYDFNAQPTLKYMGLQWFLFYAVILVFCHHLILFFLEIFRMTSFFSTLLRTVYSTLFTVLIMVIQQYLTFRKS